MSSKNKLVLNSANVRKLLRGEEMQQCLQGLGDQMAKKGKGESTVFVPGSRAIAVVRGENKDNSLLKAR